MIIRALLAGWLLIAIAANLHAADPKTTFREAIEAYAAEDFAKSAELLHGLTDDDVFSANLFYNLANSQFQLGEHGSAMVNYERTLLIDPGHSDALHNLVLTQRQLGRPVWNPIEQFAVQLGNGVAAWTGALAFWVAIFALAALLFRGGRGWKIALAVLGLAWAGCCTSVLLWQHNHLTGPDLALIIGQEATARYAPTETSSTAGQVPDGTPARILAERDSWFYTQLEDGRRLWLADDHVERLRF